MRKYLFSLIMFALPAAVSADTIRATVNGMLCGFCATAIEKTFKRQAEVKAVEVDLENWLVTVQTRPGQQSMMRSLGNSWRIPAIRW
jgi:hypothetical protein